MVEGARLESVFTGNCNEGSNPSLSAMLSCSFQNTSLTSSSLSLSRISLTPNKNIFTRQRSSGTGKPRLARCFRAITEIHPAPASARGTNPNGWGRSQLIDFLAIREGKDRRERGKLQGENRRAGGAVHSVPGPIAAYPSPTRSAREDTWRCQTADRMALLLIKLDRCRRDFTIYRLALQLTALEGSVVRLPPRRGASSTPS